MFELFKPDFEVILWKDVGVRKLPQVLGHFFDGEDIIKSKNAGKQGMKGHQSIAASNMLFYGSAHMRRSSRVVATNY